MRVVRCALGLGLVILLSVSISGGAQVPPDPADPPTTGSGDGVGVACIGLSGFGDILCWTDVFSFGFTREGDVLHASVGNHLPTSVGGSCTYDPRADPEFDGSVGAFVVHDHPCIDASASASWIVPQLPGPCELGVHVEGSDGTFTVQVGANGVGFCA